MKSAHQIDICALFHTSSDFHKAQLSKTWYLLVLSVKFCWVRRWYGIWMPLPDWPQPPYWMARGWVAPNRGCSEVTLKSGLGVKLIWSLMGRPSRQSEPDHEDGNKILMVSKRALVAWNNFSDVEVKSSWKKRERTISNTFFPQPNSKYQCKYEILILMMVLSIPNFPLGFGSVRSHDWVGC